MTRAYVAGGMAGIARICLLVCCAACGASPQRLVPAPRATGSAAAPGAVRAADAGVELVAQVNAWPGDPGLARDVIPIRVWLHNHGAAAVRLRYDDLTLVAADGSRYAALPPVGPAHLVEDRGIGTTVPDPAFGHAGFLVAPYLAYAYPTLPAYDGPYDYQTGYFRRYREASEKWLRDHPQAVRLAIPEGVVQSGGVVEGFLYFERVHPSDANKGLIRLRADLETTSAAQLAVLSIPFAMEDD